MGTALSDERAARARQTMDSLSRSVDVFETFFDQARIGLALADLSTSYVRANRTYAQLLGRRPEDLIGVPFTGVLQPEDSDLEHARIEALLDGSQESLATEERYVDSEGRTLWVLHGITVVRDDAGRPEWFAVSAQDITERRRVESDLRSLTATLAERAVRDPLTGLANRTLLEERLRAVLSRSARTGESVALLFLDLDGFKAVNDVHGHAVGDQVLTAVSRRLATAVRPSDTVARIGGDEFVVLVEAATDAVVERVVTRLREAVRMPVPTLDLDIGVSIGVALAHQGDTDALSLLGAADAAMYTEKASRRAAG